MAYDTYLSKLTQSVLGHDPDVAVSLRRTSDDVRTSARRDLTGCKNFLPRDMEAIDGEAEGQQVNRVDVENYARGKKRNRSKSTVRRE